MYRIDNATAVPNATGIPTPSAPGVNVNGFFTAGNPATGTPATIVDQDWANAVQEEIAECIEGNNLTLSKTNHNQLFQAMMGGPGKNERYYTASTTLTVPAGITLNEVECWGAGGGAGGVTGTAQSSGGTGGAYARKVVSVTPGQVITITIGAAGTGGVGATNGGTGGTTSFGALLSAPGGGPGFGSSSGGQSTTSAGTAGATSGALNLPGYSGSGGAPNTGGGAGGGSPMGIAGAPAGSAGGTGAAGLVPGGGGAGTSSSGASQNGGAGGGGLCIVKW